MQKAPVENPLFQGVDGVMVALHHQEEANTRIKMKMITDGLSKTAMAGEAVHDTDAVEAKGHATRAPARWTRKIIGGVAATTSTHLHSWICPRCSARPVCPSTRRTPTLRRIATATRNRPGARTLQLSFGSKHSGITQMVFCDGHVEVGGGRHRQAGLE